MPGRLIAVVGPSGVGKDSVMEALAASDDFGLVRRVITRPSAAGGEDFEGVSAEEFESRLAEFVLHWQAHGMSYGVPGWPLRDDLDARDMLVNLSRKVLVQAAKLFPNFTVLSLTARPEVLAARLAARGRESAAEISARLARGVDLPTGLNIVEIDNSGPLAETVLAARLALGREALA